MKIGYIIGVLIFFLGLGLLIWGTSGGEELTLLGLPVHSRVAKGLGIISIILSIILSIIALLAAYGGSVLPRHDRHRP
jgi:hypothetical protein